MNATPLVRCHSNPASTLPHDGAVPFDARWVVRPAAFGMALGFCLASLSACGNETANYEPPTPATSVTVRHEIPCSSPEAGCPCVTEGETLWCGEAIARTRDAVSCWKLLITCENQTWSECRGPS